MLRDRTSATLGNQKFYSLVRSIMGKPYLINSMIYMAGNVLSQALAFFALPIFTRYLTPDDYGILSYTGSITSIIFILSTLSLNSFVLRHYFELDTEKQRKRLFGTIFLLLFMVNVLLLGLEFLFLPLVLKYLHIQVPFYPYFGIALLDTFLEVASVLPLAYYRVTTNAWKYFWLTSLKSIFSISLGLVLVIHFEMGVMGRYYGSLGTNIGFLVVYLSIVLRIASFRPDLRTVARGLSFSLPLLPPALASIAFVSLDRIILERYVSLGQMGIYSVGLTLGSMLTILIRSFYLRDRAGDI